HESDLNREGEPCCRRFRQMPLARDLRRDRRHGKPQRHTEQQRNGKQNERGPAAHLFRNTAARNSARLCVPLFSKMLRTCVFTVSGDTPISRAMASFERPRTTRIATSRSRSVSGQRSIADCSSSEIERTG